MSTSPRRSGFWFACLVAGAGVGAVAARWSQAEAPPKTIIKSPQDLSSAFRAVSGTALPAIVSIETRIKGRILEADAGDEEVDGQQPDPLRDSPLGDDPFFREFFGQRGGGGRSMRRRMQIPAQKGAGSGFVIDTSGVIVTNAHVVSGADEVVVKLADGTEVMADSWVGDTVTDVAVIQLNDLQRKTVGSTIFPLTFEISHTTGAKGNDQRGWSLKAKQDGLPKPCFFLATNLVLPILAD